MIIGRYSGILYERQEQPKPHKKKTPPPTKPLCTHCGLDPIRGNGLCMACMKYKQVYGIERSQELIQRARERRTEPLWCKVCDSPKLYKMRRCEACYKHWGRTGEERPEWRWNQDACCLTCGFPRKATPLSKRGHHRFFAGRCEPCHNYRRQFKRERPKQYWGIGKRGWCDCGGPAEHKVDGLKLCNRCVEHVQNKSNIGGKALKDDGHDHVLGKVKK